MSWRADYWTYQGKSNEEWFATFEEAMAFLYEGEKRRFLSTDTVTDPQGHIVINDGVQVLNWGARYGA